MKPINFKQSNLNLTKPDGMKEECGSLPVYTNGSQCISLWKLTWKERLQILFRGKLWVGLLSGTSQPPIWMDANKTVFNENVK